MILSDLSGGVILALRRWRHSLTATMIIAVVAGVLSLILGDVLTQAGALRGGAHLREAHSVTFTPIYPPGEVSETARDSLDSLREEVNNHRAYSSIIGNVATDNPTVFDGIDTIIVVGDTAFQMFPSMGQPCAAPCALRGKSLPVTDRAITYHGLSFTLHGHLPANAVWFDPNASGLSLDSYQVLLFPADYIYLLDDYETEELLAKSVLLSPDIDLLNSYIHSAAQHGLYLVPSDLSEEHPRRFSGLITRFAIYVLALVSFSMIAAFTYTASMHKIIMKEIRSFAIRRIYGASSWRLHVRLYSFIAASVLVIPLTICVALIRVGPPVNLGAEIMAALLLLIYLGISLRVSLILRRGEVLL